MDRAQLTQTILAAKQAKGFTWATLAEKLGMSELYVASCSYGENSMTEEHATQFGALLDLGPDVCTALTRYPTKGNSLCGQLVPTDPLMYRFYEILLVYGSSLKDVIQEKFGDGIMSAIDFTLDVQRVEHPKGDRVVVTMDGKFLPYKRF